MNIEKTVKKKSLKRLWATVLSSVFVLIYLASSFIMFWFIKQSDHANDQENYLSYAEQVVNILSQSDRPLDETTVKNLFQNTPLALDLNKAGMTIRMIDTQEKVFYETYPMPMVVFRKNNLNKLDTVTINQRQEQIISREIRDKQTDQLKGYVQFVFHFNTYYQRSEQINRIYIVISLLAVILCIIAGNFLAYIFFKPIKHMTEVMAHLKEDALSKKRMDLSKKREDELTELSVGFNDLLDTMDLYINQQKQFVEDVSHELRTPVAVVEGHLKLLNRWGKDDPVVLAESLEASLLEIERMKTLVQEMLDLSRAEQVGIHYKNDLTEVVGVVEQVHQNFKLIYPDFDFGLDNDLPADSKELWVGISRHHLEQILIILLDNAVKYSLDQKQINISVSKTITNVQISIQDYGEGIKSEDIQKIFGRFYRVDKARSRHKGGNGLGLSIAKELVEGYKGNIGVESVGGSGSTFRINFPIVTDNARIVQEKRKVKQNNLINK